MTGSAETAARETPDFAAGERYAWSCPSCGNANVLARPYVCGACGRHAWKG